MLRFKIRSKKAKLGFLFAWLACTRKSFTFIAASAIASCLAITTGQASTNPGKASADPELENQWWAKNLMLEKVWQHATGKGVTIASCDAGVFLHEADLEPNLITQKRYDFSDKDHPRSVNDGKFVSQGTAAAALMVGVKDGQGTNGIAYNAKLIPLQNFNYDSELDDLDKELATASCIRAAAATRDVRVLLVVNQTRSGSAEAAKITRSAVKEAIEAGVIVVSTAGDSSVRLSNDLDFRTGSIVVGAIQRNESAALFSNYGERVTIGAYGEKIFTLGGQFGEMKNFAGSPAAAAQVAATVALMLEVQPKLLPTDIERILKQTRETTRGNLKVGGRLNILKAITAAQQSMINTDAWERAQLARLRYTQKSKNHFSLDSLGP